MCILEYSICCILSPISIVYHKLKRKRWEDGNTFETLRIPPHLNQWKYIELNNWIIYKYWHSLLLVAFWVGGGHCICLSYSFFSPSCYK